VAEDWRVSVTLDEEEGGLHLLRLLPEMRLESEVRDRLGSRLSVSRDGPTVFVYADAESSAREAERVVREETERRGQDVTIAVHRWHPIEERWEEPAVPLPDTPAEVEAEREVHQDDEERESVERHRPGYEVRLEVGEHADAVALAERLEGEGLWVDRHWKYVLVGAGSSDEAAELAGRLREEVPSATIEFGPSGEVCWEVAPSNPFAIFGGLGV
jgi:hypothetical protein